LVAILVVVLPSLFGCGKNDYQKARSLYYAPGSGTETYREALSLLQRYLQNHSKDPQALVLLWKCQLKLDDPAASLTRQRIRSLQMKAVPGLVDHLKDKDEVLREQIAQLLGEIGGPEAIKALQKLLENDPYYNVQRTAATALAALKAESAVDPLLEKLNHSDALVRYYAAQVLEAFPTPRVQRALLHTLLNPQEAIDVRHQATLSLASMRPLAFRDTLRQAVTSPEESLDTRLFAAYVLGSLGDTTGFGLALQTARSSPNLFWQGIALSTLGRMKRPEALPVLKDALLRAHRALRLRAAEALREMNSPESLQILRLALEDPAPEVRAVAESTLSR